MHIQIKLIAASESFIDFWLPQFCFISIFILFPLFCFKSVINNTYKYKQDSKQKERRERERWCTCAKERQVLHTHSSKSRDSKIIDRSS